MFAVLLGISSAALAEGNVSVIHGIPGLPVDVYVNDALFLDDFQPNTVTNEVALPAGSYKLDITTADASSNQNPVLTATLPLEDNDNFSIVAHLKADGTPTITPFRNQFESTGDFAENLILRHTAAAPAVDVVIRRGRSAFATKRVLVNGQEESGRIRFRKVLADVLVSGTSTAVIEGAELSLSRSKSTTLYVIGDPAQGTLGVLAETKVIHSQKAANRVPAIREFLKSLSRRN
jgi:hypothetical protein